MSTIITVYVLVEGQSEEKVIKNVIAPPLAYQNIFLYPMTMPTSNKQKGGAVNFERLSRNIGLLLKQQQSSYITTFLDLYQLDNSFPSFEESLNIVDTHQRVQFLEEKLQQEICKIIGCRKERFIAHIQPYELEALLFSDVSIYNQVVENWQNNINELQSVYDEFETPEHINNSFATAPSKRLEHILKPKYRKTRHAPLLAEKIGLAKIEKECLHFSAWLNKIRQLQALN